MKADSREVTEITWLLPFAMQVVICFISQMVFFVLLTILVNVVDTSIATSEPSNSTSRLSSLVVLVAVSLAASVITALLFPATATLKFKDNDNAR